MASDDTDTLTREVAEQQTSDGDHDVFAHYVEKSKIPDAIIMGTPLRALCGKLWVPFRDPEKYPVCPDCQKAMDEIVGMNLPGKDGRE